jgi:flagellar motor component MotA
MMYDMLNKTRRDGLVALETDIEEPISQSFPSIGLLEGSSCS